MYWRRDKKEKKYHAYPNMYSAYSICDLNLRKRRRSEGHNAGYGCNVPESLRCKICHNDLINITLPCVS